MDAAWSLGLTSGSWSRTRSPRPTRSRPTRSPASSRRPWPTSTSAASAAADATPYLLGRIVELTDGASLTANIALVRENARVGAQIAVRYAALQG
jgi:pseudouridine-5'-phosphate glycosidase